MTSVILNSGGMDSFLVAFQTQNRSPVHVFVDIGHKYVEKELLSARRIAKHFGCDLIEMRGADIGRYEHATGIIPLRNAELILCAAQHGDKVLMGILADEMNSDKSFEFLRAMETVVAISCRAQYWQETPADFRVVTPLVGASKAHWIEKVYKYGTSADWSALLQTVSCYAAQETHCGRCASCFKRWVALSVACGYDAHDNFDQHPADAHPLAYWRTKGYTEQRFAEIAAAYKLARRE